jgi:MFS family permease
MKQEELSAEKSLKLINRMIYEAKGYFHESGLSALVYGLSVLISSLLAYALTQGYLQLPFTPFWLLVPVFFIQAFIQMREDRKKKVKTFTDETIDYVWMGYFLSVIIAASFIGITYKTITIFLFLTGYASFITGMITRFTYHKVTGVICLLIAAYSFYQQDESVFLLLALAAILVWIIPSFILRAHFNKQNRIIEKATLSAEGNL